MVTVSFELAIPAISTQPSRASCGPSGLGRILNVLKLCDKTECLLCSLTALKRDIEKSPIPISPLERLAPFLGELVKDYDQLKLFDADEFVRSVVGRLLKDAEGHSEKVLISQNFYNWENPLVGTFGILTMPPTGPLVDGKPTTSAIAQDLVDSSDLTFITNRPWTVFLCVNGPPTAADTYNLDLEFPDELQICGFPYRLETVVKYHPRERIQDCHYTAHHRHEEGWVNCDDAVVNRSKELGPRWPRYAVYVDMNINAIFLANAYANVGTLMDPLHPAKTNILYNNHLKAQIRADMHGAVDVDKELDAAKKIKNTQARMRTDDALASNADGEEILDIVGSNIRDEVRLAALATQSRVNE